MEDLDSDEILTNAHAGMLNDNHRHLAYKSAISTAITTIHNTHNTVRLLDIGTGTGLLSLFAAKAGAEFIVACESNSTMCGVARRIIKHNSEKWSEDVVIRIEECSSDQLDRNPSYRNSFNVIVSEIYDSILVGEGCIPTYRHALKHLAAPDCIFIPQQATLYAQPAFSETLKSLYLYSDHIQDHPSENFISNSRYLLYEVPFEAHLDKIPDLKLGPRTNLYTWNFNKDSMDTWTGSKTHKIPINSDHAECIGLLVWWSSYIDSENIITLAPKSDEAFQEFRDHWMPLMYFLCPQTSDFSINITVTDNDIKISHVDPTVCICSSNSDINFNPRSIGMRNSSRLNKPLSNKLPDYSDNGVILEDTSNSTISADDPTSERTILHSFYDPFCLTSLSYFYKHLKPSSKTLAEVDLTVFLVDSPQIYNKFVPPASIDDFTISCYQEQVKKCLRNLRGDDLVEPIYLWEYDYRVISEKLSIGKLLKTATSDERTLLFCVQENDCRLTNIIFSLNYWRSDKGFENELYHKVDCYTNVDKLQLMCGNKVAVKLQLKAGEIQSIAVFKV